MKILLPTDGSDCALRAADHLLLLCNTLREVPEIHLLNVHRPIPIGRVQAHIGKEQLLAYYREESEEMLAPAQARLEAAGCQFTKHVHVGQPAETITRLAGAEKIDLIVMGTHGRGGFANLVMGSVASQVLHLAGCPVLLVK